MGNNENSFGDNCTKGAPIRTKYNFVGAHKEKG